MPIVTPPPVAVTKAPVVTPPPVAATPAERREPALPRARPAPAPEVALPFDAAFGTILYSADRKLAIIDNRIVGVGDEVRGARVVEITATQCCCGMGRDSSGGWILASEDVKGVRHCGSSQITYYMWWFSDDE